MIYNGYFRDIKETLYKVEIITDKNNNVYPEELLFTDSPVIIEYVSNNEDAYKPYKCSRATISLLLKKPIFDLNSAFSNRVRVNIYRNNNELIWCGYATPNSYSQPYENYYDLFELEAQDGISTLLYFKYQFELPYGSYTNKINNYYDSNYDKMISDHNYCTNFLHIIQRLNSRLDNMYKEIYVSDSIVVEGLNDLSCLDAIFIDEKNFFDEDGESWDCLEVLEQICRYCGLTCIADGSSLYFINQDAICRGYNTYFKYSLSSNKLVYSGKSELSDDRDINIDSFNRNGTNLSIDSVFNKATVKDDLYAVDSLVPDIEDDDYLVESLVSNYRTPNEGSEYKWDSNTFTNSVRTDGTIVLRCNRNGRHWVYLKGYGYNWTKDPNKKYILRWYNKPSSSSTIDFSTMTEILNMNPKDFTYGFMRDKIGATIVKYGVSNVDDYDNLPTTPEMKQAVMIHYKMDSNIMPQIFFSKGGKPVFECITDSYLMRKNDVIIINGSVEFNEIPEILPIDNNRDSTMHSTDISFIWCKLLVGNLWLVTDITDTTTMSGTYTHWSDTEGYFKLPLEYDNNTRAFATPISFKNTVDGININKKGFAISCPSKMYGTINKVKFTMMLPHGVVALNSSAPTMFALLKDFDISVSSYINDTLYNKDDNTKFTNVITEGAIEEYDDIDLKICTNDNKNLNLSLTFYIKGIGNRSSISNIKCSFVNDDVLVDGVKLTDYLRYNNKPKELYFDNVSIIFNKAKGDFYCPEDNIISNIVEQYNSPTLNIELNLYNHLNLKPYSLVTYKSLFPEYRFCIDKLSYDLGDDLVKVKIISKKYEYDS